MKRTAVFYILTSLLLLSLGHPCICTGQAPAPAVGTAIGAKPAPAPQALLPLIGDYQKDSTAFSIAEKGGRLHLVTKDASLLLVKKLPGIYELPAANPFNAAQIEFIADANKNISKVKIKNTVYERSVCSLRIKPLRPISELRAEALMASPPHEDKKQRKSELVEITKLDPSIRLDIRYATDNNFMGVALYEEARAFLQKPAAEALVRAAGELRKKGYSLKVYDAYRPWYVTKMFWDATPDPQKIYVADPAKGSRHNRGTAVDLTLCDISTEKEIDMGGFFDEFGIRAWPDYKGGTSLQRWYRTFLQDIMKAQGFTVYPNEWWHFDHSTASEYPIMNVRFSEIGSQGRDSK